MKTTQKTKLKYKHWRLETDVDTILWVYFDKQGAAVNTVDRETMEEFSAILTVIAGNPQYAGVILASGKPRGFIAGADISQFNQFKDIKEAESLLTLTDDIFANFENLTIPTVAMIDGFCLGGGLELALACHYRVVESGPKTRLGFPEVKLGIHPGWGGSVRMPKLIGAVDGMNLVLSGHTVSGKAAAKLGFADAAVPRRHLVRAAKDFVLNTPPRHQASFLQHVSNMSLSRKLLASYMRKQLRKKANPMYYPAPFQVLDNWERYGVDGHLPYEKEARSCSKLFFSETSNNLVRIFFLQERLKGLAKDSHFEPRHVHVIGAGTMGGDIAAWCAMQGMRVTLQDREAKFIAPALKRAYALFKEKLKEPHLVQKAFDLLMPDVQGLGIKTADLIIEAIYEDLAAKQATFKAVEAQAKPSAILATNTSSIPLDEINTVLKDPSRLVGIHFFNPVAKMLLVEVVKGDKTSTDVYDRAMTFVRKLDRLPLPVKSKPGFLVNRILMPYLLEGVAMMDEGVKPEIIDKAMLDWGMPMGPVTLADTVGLDVCLSVTKHLAQYFPKTLVPACLEQKVREGKLGCKTGEGFYQYKNGKPIRQSGGEDLSKTRMDEIANRLILCMLNEAFACLKEGVVADADLLDAGMVFGTGFAPFRGGPMHYAKIAGIEAKE